MIIGRSCYFYQMSQHASQNPIIKFEEWYQQELNKTNVTIPSACCLSTLGLDNYPNARIVSLKEVNEKGFVITGSKNSRKGLELQHNKKASLTFWWTETERQVRLQGGIEWIPDELADKYFSERGKDSQVVSQVSHQGNILENPDALEKLFEMKKEEYDDEVPRPKDWTGFVIIPKRIEFMEFKKSRFHHRELFIKGRKGWVKNYLQP